jgi:UDP-3-O-[3-hydroxymyristoyl] glucosamine N-acyltransferase
MVVLQVRELAARIGGEPRGDGDRPIAGVSTPEAAGPTDLICIDRPELAEALARSRAGAAIVPLGVTVPPPIAGIETAYPALAMARAVDLLIPPTRTWRSVSNLAVVAASAFVAEGAAIGPFAVIGEEVRVGRNAEIHSGATIGAGCEIGEGTIVHAGVRLYPRTFIGSRVVLHSGAVIGADGATYVPEPTSGRGQRDEPISHRKMRAVGRVVIEDEVEVGANTSIDRATLAETRVGRGCKIGPLATIGGDSHLGLHCVVHAQASIAAGTALADYSVVSTAGNVTGRGD